MSVYFLICLETSLVEFSPDHLSLILHDTSLKLASSL